LPKSTPAQRKALREIDYRITKAESITKLITAAFRWGALSFMAYMFFRSVEALAGHLTRADLNLGVRFLVAEKLDEVLAIGVGLGGFLYGWRQRKFRKDDIEGRSNRIAELERMIDPGRSSSQLNRRGGTNPEDI
jgi:hypothetical protein